MNQCFPQVSRHFCRDRCWSPGFLCDVCSVCTDFYHYPENGEGAKEVNLWMPALHTCIPYGHLGNSWRTSFHSAGLSHPSTILIEKIAFLWTSISKVLWNSNFPVFFRTITQLHSGRADKRKVPLNLSFPLEGNAIKPRPFLIQGANCASNMAIE